MSTPEPQVFVTTRWTQVLAARGGSESGRLALSQLCATYYRPVLAYLRQSGADDPEEVAHAFFAELMSGDSLSGAERGRGKFRSYLLGALKHFVANQRRRASRLKHGGGAEHVPLPETADAEELLAAEPTGLDARFDREWAVTLVESALQTLEAEARAAGSETAFGVLKAWLSFEREPGSQAEAAARLGMNEGAVKVAIHRLRRRFRECVRQQVRETLPAGVSEEEELGHLIAALAG